jgi:molecular chaperone DnaK (HSP70)
MLLKYFNKDESFVREEINPDTAVARGAAIMGYRFAPTPPPFDIRKHTRTGLINVDAEDQIIAIELIAEHSLGVEVKGGIFSKIIERGTHIPCERKVEFTNEGPHSDFQLRIYQGEGEYVYENTLIGTLYFGPFESKPAGTHRFEVTFTLDKNGLLHATVHHINKGKKYEATLDTKGSAGGVDALAAKRKRLLYLYASK